MSRAAKANKRYLVVKLWPSRAVLVAFTGPRGAAEALTYQRPGCSVRVIDFEKVLALPDVPHDEIKSKKLWDVLELRRMMEKS